MDINDSFVNIGKCLELGRILEARLMLDNLSYIENDDSVSRQDKFWYFTWKDMLADKECKPQERITNLLKALEYADDDENKESVLIDLAGLYCKIGEYANSKLYSDRALAINSKEEFKCVIYRVKGRCALAEKQYAEALKWFSESELISNKLVMPVQQALSVFDMAKVFVAMDKTEIALNEMRRAAGYAKNAGDLNLFRRIGIKMADILMKKGSQERAATLIDFMTRQED